jgi:NTP pyrophosphatase (non-canonical NTP hydrolase)
MPDTKPMPHSTLVLSLSAYQEAAAKSDRFKNDAISVDQLRYGFFGEVGSLLAAVKKYHRDTAAPSERESAEEELGDALWYLAALVRREGLAMNTVGEATILELQRQLHVKETKRDGKDTTFAEIDGLLAFQRKHLPEPKDVMLYRLATLTSALFGNHAVNGDAVEKCSIETYAELLATLSMLAAKFDLRLSHIAEFNIEKIQSRWPNEFMYTAPFDVKAPPFEQLPREFTIKFIRRVIRGKEYIVQQLDGVNIGDPLTDNRTESDGYRYHDVFHLAYIAHLGWSPVVRGLLKLKRKSDPAIDENQDGARAMIIEEGIATWIFNYARERQYFANVEAGKLDYALLKQVKMMVSGYEVDSCPLWQWEKAILDGFAIFRALKDAKEGVVKVSMKDHRIEFSSHPDSAGNP